jgi:hypothetical protein
MLACVCPGSSSTDHTLNTLRYAERLKERTNKNAENDMPLIMKKAATTIQPETIDVNENRSTQQL